MHIVGYRELIRGLRRVDSELPKLLRKATNDAAQIVVDEAVPLVPRLTGAASKSVRVASTQRAARVKAGGKKVPYFGFLEFGGSVGPKKTSKRPFIREGRYLWPAIIRRREDIIREMEKAVRQVSEGAGLGVD
ncbi:HK97 gp10 family phage protein (plasmid) [Pseudonocardia broussonetiae]|uniref:HK97 gp10 family phage protein n=1 Tax=Pseudonocardia broussonetiae TaxID=2736640 RepID=A0A6M6JYS2_9PSEU|nr:HK97 gp10 family phage protein [Pseudonocardia broussonetiae]